MITQGVDRWPPEHRCCATFFYFMNEVYNMSDLQELKNELMQDPDFWKEYEALQPEMDAIRASIESGHKSLEERAAEFDGNLNLAGELDWGEPVGREHF